MILTVDELDYLIGRVALDVTGRFSLLKKLSDEKEELERREAIKALNGPCKFAIVFTQRSIIQAIKLHRSLTGYGLRESKDAIDASVTRSDGKREVFMDSDAATAIRAFSYIKDYPEIQIEIKG